MKAEPPHPLVGLEVTTVAINAQEGQILVALEAAPLDRIRLMKTLFLVWHRSGRPNTGPFDFQPYLYGPCALDLYTALDGLKARGLVIPQRGRSPVYHLTESGKREAVTAPVDARLRALVAEIARWAVGQELSGLVNQVYAEAPDFAAQADASEPKGSGMVDARLPSETGEDSQQHRRKAHTA